MLRSCGFQGGALRHYTMPPFDSVSPSSSPLFPTPWGVYPLSIVYVKKMIIIYRIWDQKFHLPFPCPLSCVYVSKLQMTQTFPQAIIRHKNVQQMLCVCVWVGHNVWLLAIFASLKLQILSISNTTPLLNRPPCSIRKGDSWTNPPYFTQKYTFEGYFE